MEMYQLLNKLKSKKPIPNLTFLRCHFFLLKQKHQTLPNNINHMTQDLPRKIIINKNQQVKIIHSIKEKKLKPQIIPNIEI